VRKAMDDAPVTCTLETELDEIRRIMLERHARWLPLGEAVWGNTFITLPDWCGIEGTRFENILTGEVLAVQSGGLSMADLFASFPGAVLRRLAD
jgi:hypothetical protein